MAAEVFCIGQIVSIQKQIIFVKALVDATANSGRHEYMCRRRFHATWWSQPLFTIPRTNAPFFCFFKRGQSIGCFAGLRNGKHQSLIIYNRVAITKFAGQSLPPDTCQTFKACLPTNRRAVVPQASKIVFLPRAFAASHI